MNQNGLWRAVGNVLVFSMPKKLFASRLLIELASLSPHKTIPNCLYRPSIEALTPCAWCAWEMPGSPRPRIPSKVANEMPSCEVVGSGELVLGGWVWGVEGVAACGGRQWHALAHAFASPCTCWWHPSSPGRASPRAEARGRRRRS